MARSGFEHGNDPVTGLIFDIQGHSVHDGPGCRTVVFLSGCPLRCAWCANPEGQLPRPRLMYSRGKCVPGCRRCVDACPHGAARREETGRLEPSVLRLDRRLCDRCDTLECVAACLHEALTVSGRRYTVDDLMGVLVRDQGFWGDGGGVTFSGGEPLAQPDFLLAALEACRTGYIHTAIETCAHVEPGLWREVLRWTDWLFVDLKHMDSEAHRSGIGVGNELIHRNIETAAASWTGRLIVRVPVVPGFNDSQANLKATAVFMARIGLREVHLLPFHRLGASKYERLGLEYPYAQVAAPSGEALLAHRQIFAAAGLHCYLGVDTPF